MSACLPFPTYCMKSSSQTISFTSHVSTNWLAAIFWEESELGWCASPCACAAMSRGVYTPLEGCVCSIAMAGAFNTCLRQVLNEVVLPLVPAAGGMMIV